MSRRYRALGLALIVALAGSAFAAQGASAVPLTCSVPQGATCFLTGDQDGGIHEFVTAGGVFKCPESSFSASPVVGAGGAINELTVKPSIPTEKSGGGTNCVAFGFVNVHVITHECEYTFTTPTDIGNGLVTWDPTKAGANHVTETASQLHLVCPTGKAITITPTALGASVCTQSTEPQTPTTGHILGENVAGSIPMDITLRITVEGLHYKGTGGSCGDATTHVDRKWAGNSTYKCYADAAHTKQVDCTFS